MNSRQAMRWNRLCDQVMDAIAHEQDIIAALDRIECEARQTRDILAEANRQAEELKAECS